MNKKKFKGTSIWPMFSGTLNFQKTEKKRGQEINWR